MRSHTEWKTCLRMSEGNTLKPPPVPTHSVPILSVVFLATRGACVEACWTLLMGVEARRVVTY